MSDYINRDKVLKMFIEGDGHDDERFTEGYNFAVEEYREKVKNIPAADVQPVKQGHWIEITSDWEDDYFKCSECGEEWYLEVGTPIENGMKYCPNCGARMKDGEQNDKTRNV